MPGIEVLPEFLPLTEPAANVRLNGDSFSMKIMGNRCGEGVVGQGVDAAGLDHGGALHPR